MHRIILALIATLFIAGCSDSAINAVKSESPRSSDFTYEQILGDSSACEKTSWSRESDSNGRPVVVYSCKLAVKDETVEALKNQAEKALEVWGNELIARPAKKINLIKEHQVNRMSLLETHNLRQEEALIMMQKRIENKAYYGSPGSGSLQEQLAEMQSEEGRKEAEKRFLQPYNHGPVDTAQQDIAAVEGWAPKHDVLAKEFIESEHAKMNAFYKDDSTKNLELRLKFLVQNKGPIELTYANWFQGGVEGKSGINPGYLGAIFSNPKFMNSVAAEHITNTLKFQTDRINYRLPFVCGADIPGGCGPKPKPE